MHIIGALVRWRSSVMLYYFFLNLDLSTKTKRQQIAKNTNVGVFLKRFYKSSCSYWTANFRSIQVFNVWFNVKRQWISCRKTDCTIKCHNNPIALNRHITVFSVNRSFCQICQNCIKNNTAKELPITGLNPPPWVCGLQQYPLLCACMVIKGVWLLYRFICTLYYDCCISNLMPILLC